MFVNEKGKLFGKINVIDLLVVVLILAAAFATYFKFNKTPVSTSAQQSADFVYTLKVSDIRDYSASQFKEGENIYDDETGKFIGVIKEAEKKDYMDYVLKSDGTYNYAKKPERYEVYLTVETNGAINDSGYFAEGIRQISPESTIIISNKRVRASSSVVSVEQ